jgi:hypothetical protein
MGSRGVGASFKLGSAGSPATLVDISTWLNNIEPSSSVGEYDATCFQPGVATPLKTTIPGFADKGFTLSGIWTAAVESHFAELEGLQGVAYEYGPDGATAGDTKIDGLCNVMSYSGPKAPVDGVITFDVTLKVTTRTVGVFAA